jgi:hypothetical protein
LITVHPNEEVVGEWRRRVEAEWGIGTHSHTLAAVEGLVMDLLEGTVDAIDAMSEIGRRCALDRHELVDVAGWMTILVEISPRKSRRRFESRVCAEALASGWAHAVLDLRAPLRRLAPLAVLRMRLKELADQCNALGLDLVRHYVLVVLDVDTGALGPHGRRSVLRHVADAAQRTFRAGETVVATDSGRILVLGPRRRELPGEVHTLISEAQMCSGLASHRVCGWIEPLPRSSRYLDALIDSLAF